MGCPPRDRSRLHQSLRTPQAPTVHSPVLHLLHDRCGALLNAFMIRRLKREVLATLPRKTEALIYVPMSKTQAELSRQLLLSGAQVLARLAKTTEGGKEEVAAGGSASKDWLQMQSLLMSLRKCCNHPQLFGEWMAEVSDKLGEDVVASSGKLATLDLMLQKLLPAGHRVVLFSGWTSMLDIIEEFLKQRSIGYARLDGSTNRVQRQIDIKQFNARGSSLSVFLCSTRAGGLGITLTSADTVVLYDSDFNPQVDLQAMDRVHRIGQTKPVTVFRLVTHATVEERIVQRARDKIYLMQATMKAGAEAVAPAEEEQQQMPGAKVSRAEMIALLQFGVAGALASLESDQRVTVSQLDAMLSDVAKAAAAGSAQVSAGIGGRQSTSQQGGQGVSAAAAAAALGGAEDGEVELAPEEIGAAVEALGRGSRKVTSRFEKNEETGDLVLKINNYTLEQGEMSVFDSELGGRQARAGERKQNRIKAGTDFENCSQCQLCWKKGDVLCCDFCPVVLHAVRTPGAPAGSLHAGRLPFVALSHSMHCPRPVTCDGTNRPPRAPFRSAARTALGSMTRRLWATRGHARTTSVSCATGRRRLRGGYSSAAPSVRKLSAKTTCHLTPTCSEVRSSGSSSSASVP